MNKKLKLDELDRLSTEKYKQIEKHPIVVVLNNIRSLNNVGSFFRTCDAFAIQELILTGITASPPHREIRKTALGATESVKWSYHKNCEKIVMEHKKRGFKIAAIEQTTESIGLHKFHYDKTPLLLIFGNEVEGVDQKLIEQCDFSIEIPQFGTKHSLNVSVSAGIVLWHLIKKLV